ncbi:uncharacterized protein LOC101240177 isoform X1 [Hydra vulgaris]|uniref:uncharacterized protein LOC101240177 isoform X1 n=2 Tax=Hydra vulgaris TaxID=6087 RepID=UPI001F5E50BF|nr:uncharacterized protein LOC101240177 isoform X1 [Hydra vulgaris]
MKLQVIFLISIGIPVQCTTYSPGLLGEAFSNVQADLEHLRENLNNSYYHNIITAVDLDIIGSNSGRKARGWFAPPQSGNYIFYTTCNAMCRLYLSIDNDPLNAKLIVSQNWSSLSKNWIINSDKQASSPTYLKANRSYYLEVIVRTASSDGWSSLAVTLPNNSSVGPVQNYLLGSIRSCTGCILTNNEKCFYLNTNDGICICGNGYILKNDQCADIDECADGSNDCYGNQISCINTLGSYNCSCNNKCLVVVSNTEGQWCMEKNTSDDTCKPTLNVNFVGSLEGKSLSLKLDIYFMYNFSVDAQNVIIEYFLPSFISVSAEIIPFGFTSISQLKYMNKLLRFNRSANHIMNVSINYELRSFEKFAIEIPIIVSFQNLGGKSWSIFKIYSNQVEFQTSKSLKINKDPFALLGSYGRGLYWDEINLYIYVCMNQHVASTRAACYYSNNDGKSWTALDLQVGSIIGHHLLSNELYAVHRNEKLYLMFHKYHKKWFAITNEEFVKNVLKNINFNFWKNLENDENQVFTLSSKQWMGNAYGLFFRNTSRDTWLLRVKWPK